MTKSSLVVFVTLLIVSTLLFNGCAHNKTVIATYPGYFELPENSKSLAQMDFGTGKEDKEILTDRKYYCYDKDTQTDVLAVKRGK